MHVQGWKRPEVVIGKPFRSRVRRKSSCFEMCIYTGSVGELLTLGSKNIHDISISFQSQTVEYYPWATFANQLHAAMCVFSEGILASQFNSAHVLSAFILKTERACSCRFEPHVKSKIIISVSDGNSWISVRNTLPVSELCDRFRLILRLISSQLVNGALSHIYSSDGCEDAAVMATQSRWSKRSEVFKDKYITWSNLVKSRFIYGLWNMYLNFHSKCTFLSCTSKASVKWFMKRKRGMASLWGCAFLCSAFDSVAFLKKNKQMIAQWIFCWNSSLYWKMCHYLVIYLVCFFPCLMPV